MHLNILMKKKRKEVEQKLLQFDVKTVLANKDLLAPFELGEKDLNFDNGNKMTSSVKWEEVEESAEKLDKSTKKVLEESMEKKESEN